MRLCYVAVAFIALGTPLSHAQESARLVNCRLEGARGKVEFAGKCRFLRERGGSSRLRTWIGSSRSSTLSNRCPFQ